MVNKAVIAILLIVVLTMAGIAALIGLVLGPQFASGEATQTATDGGSNGGSGGGGGSTTTATANGTNTTSTTTTATTAPPTEPPTTTTPTGDDDATTTTSRQTTTQQTTTQPTTTTTTTDTGPDPIHPGFFNETRVEQLVVEKVNERKNRGYEDDDSVAIRVSRMARNHSQNMTERGEVVHKIDGNNSVDRYKVNDLYGVCQWEADDGTYIRRPGAQGDANNFEVIAGGIYAGQSYEQDGETRFNSNESEVADAIVDYWLSRQTYNQRLSYGNARRLGVGVNITESGEVYATGNVC